MVIEMKLQDIRNKPVVCVKDGSVLGYIRDLEFDLQEQKLISIVVEENRWKSLLSFFFNKGDTIIDLEDIEHIGEDVILVKTTHLE